MSTPYDGRITLPGQVRDKEWPYIEQRRQAATQATEETDVGELASQPLVGISLSGGGVRSATFCLGVLQSLASANVLRIVDYMCTVSGGGYIGSCLSSLFTIPPTEDYKTSKSAKLHYQEDYDPSAWKKQDQPPYKARFNLYDQFPFLLPDQMHHLRKHGDFLMLGRGTLRREFIRGVGTTLIGMLCTLTTYFLVMFSLMALFLAYTSVLTHDNLWDLESLAGKIGTPPAAEATIELVGEKDSSGDIAIEGRLTEATPDAFRWPGWESVLGQLKWPKSFSLIFWIGVVAALAGSVVALAAQECYQRFLLKPRSGETTGETSERRGLSAFALLMVIVLLVPLAAPEPFRELTIGAGEQADGLLSGLWLPLVFTVGALVAVTVLYVFFGLWDFSWNDRVRSMVGAMHGICLYGTLLALLLIATVLLIWWSTTGEHRQVSQLIVSGLASILLARLGGAVEQSKQSSLTQTLIGVVIRFGLVLAVIVFVLATAVLSARLVLLWADPSPVPAGYYRHLGLRLFGISLAFTLVVSWIIDFNRIGLHYFYRDRLVDAYLRTEAREPRKEHSDPTGLMVVRDDSRLLLQNLHENGTQEQNPAPYHLILCSLNLAGSRDLARKDRKSDHFILSREYCGSTTTGYARTARYRQGKTTLAAAMTVSGAAASSSMGFYTSFAQAFATTLFNVRLGVWVMNPRVYDDQEDDPVAYPQVAKPPRKWVDQRRWNHLLRYAADTIGERFVLGPIFLFKEMFAMTDARSLLVNISDGGHTGDNIGIYPLLQRRCQLIIACDGEADPNYDFGSFAAAIRQINIDENVKIEVDLGRVRPLNPGDPAKGHYLIGKVHYPRNPHGDDWKQKPQWPDEEAPVGWILYLKSSYTNQNEPAAVRSYAAKHVHFPHETTLDQLFSDDQFEAYRALGECICGEVLQEVKRSQASKSNAALDARAIIDWCAENF